jgi:hypothetical protein
MLKVFFNLSHDFFSLFNKILPHIEVLSGANRLIGATGAPFRWLLGNIFGIFSNKSFKKFLKFFLKKNYFVKVFVKILPKNVIFKVFQVHLQVLSQYF